LKKEIHGICALCLTSTKLCNSHIIPEFFYKPIYGDKHEFFGISTIPNQRTIKLQKGLREFLLCNKCEIQLSKYEDYAKRVIYDNTGIRNEFKDHIEISNLDYKKFKLFQLSIIWRASVTSRAEFKDVNLGVHSEKIRVMLNNEEAGEPNDYGCFLIISPKLINEYNFDKLISPPDKVRYGSHRMYRFFFGGIFWNYIISSHNSNLENKALFIEKDGTLKIILDDKYSVEYMRKEATKLVNSGNSIPKNNMQTH